MDTKAFNCVVYFVQGSYEFLTGQVDEDLQRESGGPEGDGAEEADDPGQLVEMASVQMKGADIESEIPFDIPYTRPKCYIAPKIVVPNSTLPVRRAIEEQNHFGQLGR